MKKWILIMFSSLLTVVLGVFLAIVAGTVVEEQFAIIGNGKKIVQAVILR